MRFGDFSFDPESGTLRSSSGEPAAEQRLAPKPALLLSLLLEKDGALATRDEIRERLWPDVQVDFEASLHHVVRQVRAALGDTAKDSRFIETVPRRGYRLKPRPTPPAVAVAAVAEGEEHHVRRRSILTVAAVVGVLGAGAIALAGSDGGAPRVRIAILPFNAEAMPTGFAMDASRVAEQVLLDATHGLGDSADVLGPRVTGPLVERGATFQEITTELNVAYILNLKYVGRDASPAALIELIRTADGRHVWVERFSRLDADAGTSITLGVVSELREGR